MQPDDIYKNIFAIGLALALALPFGAGAPGAIGGGGGGGAVFFGGTTGAAFVYLFFPSIAGSTLFLRDGLAACKDCIID